MLRFLLIINLLPLCIHGRFGRYGEVAAPAAQSQVKALADEVGREEKLTFSDQDKQVTAVKDETFGACFITDYDPEWNLDLQEKQDVLNSVEPQIPATPADMRAIQERVGNIIASMCKAMQIYWMLGAQSSPEPKDDRHILPNGMPVPVRVGQNGQPMELPVPVQQDSQIPVPVRPQHSSHSNIQVPMPIRPHRLQHSQESLNAPIPVRPIHSQHNVPVPIRPHHSSQQSHGSLNIPIPVRPMHSHSSQQNHVPVPIRPQHVQSSHQSHGPMKIPVPVRPMHTQAAAAPQRPEMERFSNPILVPSFQNRGRPFAQPRPMKRTRKGGDDYSNPVLAPKQPDSPNTDAPPLKPGATK